MFGGLLALILGFAGRRRLALGLGVLSLAWLWAWSLPVTSHAIRGYLENQHPAVNASAMPQTGAVVVLGGGTSPLSYGEPYPNLSAASDREWHGVRLYQAGKAPLLILTGGHDPKYRATSSAEAMRRFMSALGVPDSAIALFEAQGLKVIPAATDHEVRPLPPWQNWLPATDALHWMAAAGRLKKSWGVWWAGKEFFVTGEGVFLATDHTDQHGQQKRKLLSFSP